MLKNIFFQKKTKIDKIFVYYNINCKKNLLLL